MGKKIYFISDSIPNDKSFGSEVIFYRHLLLFEQQGYEINVFTSKKELKKRLSISFPNNWKVYCFSSEKFFAFWFLRRFRKIVHLIYLVEFFFKTKFKRPNGIIISYLWGVNLCTFAAFLKKIGNCKLHYLVHDDSRLFMPESSKNYINNINSYCIAAADNLLCVTMEIGKSIIAKSTDLKKIIQLFPIPDGKHFEEVKWTENTIGNSPILYSGSAYPAFFELFKLINDLQNSRSSKLQIIAKDYSIFKLIFAKTDLTSTTLLPPFSSNEEALRQFHLMKPILLICYPKISDDIKWAIESFPSKFIEYSFLGLPCLLIAPKETAFYKWCKKNTAIKVFTPLQTEDIKNYTHYLYTKKGWEENQSQFRDLSYTVFSPIQIHNRIPTF